ncbi:ABC transporter ATP-binding protein [Chloroflexota bacterium]
MRIQNIDEYNYLMRRRSLINAPDEKPKVTLQLLKRVLGYARPFRWWIATTLLVTIATTGLSLITPLIMRDLIDQTLPQKDLQRLLWSVVGLLVIPFMNGGLNILRRQANAQVGEGVVFNLRSSLFSHLQRMSLGFFTHTRIGELMSRLNNDVVGAQNAISNTFVNIITSLIQAVAVLSVMFALEWRLTAISIMIFPLSLIAARNMGGRLRDIARLQLDLNSRMNAVMNELLNINGALLIKLFGRSREEDTRFQKRAGEVREAGVKRAVTGVMFTVSVGLFSAVGIALVYGIGGYLVIENTLTIGTIVAMGAYLGSLYTSLQSLTNAPVDFATSIVSFERVFEVLDLETEIIEKPEAQVLDKTSGLLEFKDVSFSYKLLSEYSLLKDVHRFGQMQSVKATLSGDTHVLTSNPRPKSRTVFPKNKPRQVLKQISFVAKPGQLVALVGSSGAGKTTLTYLIPRFYDPTEGQILIDGYDLRDVNLASLAVQIGMVTQDAYLFHDTIRVNLLYGDPEATQGEIEEATRIANIHDFIAGLSDGYDTVVGERGYRLSGGEKQRLALARVILKDPRILVLDEATSSLDSESERLIKEALKQVMVGRTSIVIAHRLSTILSADLILVMDKGHIVERGTHKELLAESGLYNKFYRTQFDLNS